MVSEINTTDYMRILLIPQSAGPSTFACRFFGDAAPGPDGGSASRPIRRTKPHTMFIDGPQIDLGVEEGSGDRPQQWAQVGLEFDLGRRVTMRMAGPRFQPASAEPS